MSKRDDHITHECGDGARSRFLDRFSGDYLDSERRKGSNIGFIRYNMRFCDGCKAYKPKGKRKATKAWRCDDCLSNAR